MWNFREDGYRWGKRKLIKERFGSGIKIYKVEILNDDGSSSGMIEEMELQPFLEFCVCCGQNIVDTRKGGGCSIRNDCCEECYNYCKNVLHYCSLKT